MSALDRFADSSRTSREVREVPKPAVSRCSNGADSLLDHLVGGDGSKPPLPPGTPARAAHRQAHGADPPKGARSPRLAPARGREPHRRRPPPRRRRAAWTPRTTLLARADEVMEVATASSREFITRVSGAAGGLAARAQQPAMPVVGGAAVQVAQEPAPRGRRRVTMSRAAEVLRRELDTTPRQRHALPTAEQRQ
jgi:hypothetical protein